MQRKIPTLLGIFLTLFLVAGLAFITSQIGQVTKFFSQAGGSLAPVSLGIGNVTDIGFTVYWSTEKETSGAVFFGKTTGFSDGVAVDDRDLASPNGQYITHFVRVTGLTSNTKYYFKIGSGTGTFGDVANSGNPFTVTTGEKLIGTPVVDPIFGKVLDGSGTPLSGVIAVWEASGSGKIVSLSKSDGTYVLPIANARTLDLKSFFGFTLSRSEKISLDGGPGGQSIVSCQSGLDRPVTTVKLGQNADCSNTESTVEQKPATASAGFNSTKIRPASSGGSLSTNISDGETVSSPLPTVSGKAGPNQVVKIEIHSPTVYSGTVKADPAGNWSWTPPANLSPGQHTVTITVENADGTIQTITRTFYVSAGETILPITSGTPSGTLTHLACLSNGCVAVSGVGPDDCATDADCTVPPANPQPPPVATPPASPPVSRPPTTGTTESTLVLLTLGLISATLGIGLVWKHE